MNFLSPKGNRYWARLGRKTGTRPSGPGARNGKQQVFLSRECYLDEVGRK